MNYKTCWITLNRDCNLRCKWCYAKDTNYLASKNMDLKTVFKIVDICNDLSIKNITLIGGEPTLYPYLKETINYIHTKGLKCGLVTNGVRLGDNEFVKELVSCGIRHFPISLKGEDRDTFKDVTGKDLLDKVIEGVRNCIENDAKVSVSMVLTEENIGTYLNGIKLMKSVGVESFRLSFCYDFDTTGKLKNIAKHNPRTLIKRFIDSYEELDIITNHKFRLSQSYPMCLWDETFIKVLKSKNQITSVCQLLAKSGLLFDTDGNLIPCNAMHMLKLGKLYENFSNAKELLDYSQTEDFKQVYSKLCGVPDMACLKCSKLKYCGGGCVCQWTNYSYEQLMRMEE